MIMKSWARTLPFGLRDDFDYGVVRTKADVITLLSALPNADRGEAARALYERREHIGREVVYTALLEAWDHDDRYLIDAFGTVDAFVEALRAVTPPLRRKRPLRAWRGIVVRDAHPGEAAIGLSWTRSRDIACWFATRHCNIGGVRPFVFQCVFFPHEIVALHDGRGEQEVLVDLAMLQWNEWITVDGTGIDRADLVSDSSPPADALADWRAAGQRYAMRKSVADKKLYTRRKE
jgi:hypothetical protein